MVPAAERLQVVQRVRAATGQRADMVAFERAGRAALAAGVPVAGQGRRAVAAIAALPLGLVASPRTEALAGAARLKPLATVPTFAHRPGLLSSYFHLHPL